MKVVNSADAYITHGPVASKNFCTHEEHQPQARFSNSNLYH